MPQVVPISDFRSNIETVAAVTDNGEVAILTQNGRPRWAMIDYDEWNASARLQEQRFAQSLLESEERERAGKLTYLSQGDFEAWAEQRAQERTV